MTENKGKNPTLIDFEVLDSPSSVYSAGAYLPQTPLTWAQIMGESEQDTNNSNSFFNVTPPTDYSEADLSTKSITYLSKVKVTPTVDTSNGPRPFTCQLKGKINRAL